MKNNNSNLNKQKSKKKHRRLFFYIICHIRALKKAIRRTAQAPFLSIAALLLITVAITLPSLLIWLINDFKYLNTKIGGSPNITLYLDVGLSKSNSQKIINDLKKRDFIKSLSYISPQQGLNEFSDALNLKSIIQPIQTNPLPPVIVVTPKDNQYSPTKLQHYQKELQKIPHVAMSQLDMTWVNRLYHLLTLGERIVYIFALLFAFSSTLIVANTIRAIMQSHIQEVSILQLFGASKGFIRRPLLYHGSLFGLLGGCLALSIILPSQLWLSSPITYLTKSFGVTIAHNDYYIRQAVIILTLSTLLGWLGSWIAVRRYLTTDHT